MGEMLKAVASPPTPSVQRAFESIGDAMTGADKLSVNGPAEEDRFRTHFQLLKQGGRPMRELGEGRKCN